MIEIQIYRNSAGLIAEFEVAGHAGTAARGKDIVCAGVSALTQAAVIGLDRHLNRKLHFDMASGRLQVGLVDSPDELTTAILETMVLGLREITQISPKSVRITEHRR